MKNIIDIIHSIDTKHPNVNPTEIYNEGWMIRLLVYQSIKSKIRIEEIDFANLSNWTSEALISSPFVKVLKDKEGYTHADIALGDFTVDYEDRGEIKVLDNAKLFGIIEAKMGSTLSKGTTHAKNYDQASRNLACIAHNTFDKKCEIFFAIVAPSSKLRKHKIEKQIDLDRMIAVIEERFRGYPDPVRDSMNMKLVIAKAQSCKTWALSYEDWIDMFLDSAIKDVLSEFYQKAKKWNRIDN
ncbi:hypothetical protein ES705_31483 [subsurface metagenome]